jgi:uncharacterized protein
MTDESWLEPKSPEELSEILARLRPQLEEIYGSRLMGLYVYGSYARGDARPGSDLDVLLVLNHVDSFWQELERSAHVTSELSLEYDLTISRALVSEHDWRAADMPLVRNVRREGRAA